MGKLLCLQLHERDPDCRVRAICCSYKERDSIRFDLGGIRLVGGKMVPAVDHHEWLEIVVVDNGDEKGLEEAFRGATTAVLCSAPHNSAVQDESGGSTIVLPEASSAVLMALQDRLVAEAKTALKTPSLQHIVLRSSMGLGTDTPEDLFEAMGGSLILEGPRRAEELLASDDNPCSTTVLRLGALTDDAGPIPLEFSTNDGMLISRGPEKIPLVSRADAARVLGHTALHGAPKGMKRCADVAWGARYNAFSIMIEEVKQDAIYQDLEGQLMIAATGSATMY